MNKKKLSRRTLKDLKIIVKSLNKGQQVVFSHRNGEFLKHVYLTKEGFNYYLDGKLLISPMKLIIATLNMPDTYYAYNSRII